MTDERINIGRFLPERDYVMFGSLLYRKSVCRLSVCDVGAPYSGVEEPFGNIFSPLCRLP